MQEERHRIEEVFVTTDNIDTNTNNADNDLESEERHDYYKEITRQDKRLDDTSVTKLHSTLSPEDGIVVLIRHGKTEYNKLGIFTGSFYYFRMHIRRSSSRRISVENMNRIIDILALLLSYTYKKKK